MLKPESNILNKEELKSLTEWYEKEGSQLFIAAYSGKRNDWENIERTSAFQTPGSGCSYAEYYQFKTIYNPIKTITTISPTTIVMTINFHIANELTKNFSLSGCLSLSFIF